MLKILISNLNGTYVKKLSCLLLLSSFLFVSCGGDGQDLKTVVPETYTFSAYIDSDTLTRDQGFILHSSWEYMRDNTYTIITQEDLDLFNQTLSDYEMIDLDYLDIYTYFLIRDYGCCDYLEYSGHSYSNGALTLEMNHVSIHYGCMCGAVISEAWLVFKANKL